MHDLGASAPAAPTTAFERLGVPLSVWEEQLRAHVQQQMELAVHRLSQAAPDMLDEHGARFVSVDVTLPLPAGERVRFKASLELVE